LTKKYRLNGIRKEGVYDNIRAYNGSGRDYEQLRRLYTSPIIFRVIKLRSMRWAWYVAGMGQRRGTYMVLMERPERKSII
jgi:hypothetical protein